MIICTDYLTIPSEVEERETYTPFKDRIRIRSRVSIERGIRCYFIQEILDLTINWAKGSHEKYLIFYVSVSRKILASLTERV